MKKKSYLTKGAVILGIMFLASCSQQDDDNQPEQPDDPVVINPPIVLDCNYFKEDRILVDDPNAPVDYIINCVIPVRADIKIEPGVVIEFSQDAGIDIDDFNIPSASLDAEGTLEKPIIFRGIEKLSGYWRGIMFNSNSPKNKLIHAKVEYAGGKEFNSNGDKGAVHVYASGVLSMQNTEITNSKTYGLNATYGSSTITLQNNKFKSNDAPVIIAPPYLNAVNNTNDYTGNASDFVEIKPYTYTISQPTTWQKVNVPYKVLSGSVKFIRTTALLTVQPGVKVVWGSEMGLHIDEDGGGIKAIGTSADPIIFTGESTVPKAWKGIQVYSKHAQNEIAHVEMHYSGLGGPLSGVSNVWLWYESVLNIHNVKFFNIANCAINYRLLTGQTYNPNLTIGPNIEISPEGCQTSTW